MPLVIFFSVLLGLFTLELMDPVQIWVIQPITAGIAHVSASLLQLFDSTVHAQGILISNRETGQAVSIQPGCNGVEAMICLTAAVMATPATWRQRLFGLGIGYLAIQALNILRVISLFYLLQWNQVWFEWAHLYLWQALIILDGLIVYLLWLRTLNRVQTTETAPA
ncbi:MAG: exosortase H [Candidatus Competibacteraceae bacterium]|nr:exosortase H [Candidatus Competibacteraceae bacterium]MCB1807373.1 exosortase H [Candidatus Competibacteraceae bacterium]